MRIALINPRARNVKVSLSPPLSLGYISSYLRQVSDFDMEIKIFDGNLGWEGDFREEVVKFRPDIIGFSLLTSVAKVGYEQARYFADKLPDSTIVFGGHHASVMPEEALGYGDVVITGEGEKAFAELVRDIYYNGKPGKKVIKGERIMELDDIPSPAFELFDLDYYFLSDNNISQCFGLGRGEEIRCATMITSRGCPYSCKFCYNSTREFKRVRYHSSGRVLNEIGFLADRYNVNSLFFFDDEFMVNKDRLELICQGMMERFPDLMWACQGSVSQMRPDVLAMMKEAGCKTIGIGFESGSDHILKFLKGNSFSVEKNIRAMGNCRNAGIRVMGNFIVGSPGETIEDMLLTFDFIKTYKPDLVAVSILSPFPGTAIMEYCVNKGIIKEYNYDMLNYGSGGRDRAFCIDSMDPEEFYELFKKMEYHVLLNHRDFTWKDFVVRAVRPHVIRRFIRDWRILINR